MYAVWKKVTKGQPVRWDKEVRIVWQEIGGSKGEVLSIGEGVGYKTKVRDMIETRKKGALRCKSDKEEHLKIYGGLKRGDRDESIFAWPTGRGEELNIVRTGEQLMKKVVMNVKVPAEVVDSINKRSGSRQKSAVALVNLSRFL